MEDDKQFLLRKEYSLSGGDPIVMDRGRAVSLTVNTEPFQELTEIRILPFETAPFVNKHKVKADRLGTNHYTKLAAGNLVLVTDYKEKLTGAVEELDKGMVAVFDPGFDKFDEIEILEVRNG